MRKRERHQQILEVLKGNRVSSQEALRELLYARGTEVTQATLDLKEFHVFDSSREKVVHLNERKRSIVRRAAQGQRD